ncbi:MAG: hypothetical protein PHH54_00520 [Candidatus Nanoarchaeia archaeon]|nr:hypothetical protein [Candidatus Nanoarchaeia archaeon]MDD5740446.1 hypothetical protein [Candidatus Nanoarchaeia archaeon]
MKLEAKITIVSIIITLIAIIVTIIAINGDSPKKDIEENIALANNLIIELRFNEQFLKDKILTLNEIKDTEKYRIDKLETTITYQAREKINFGTPEIRIYLEAYLQKIKYIKESLESIKQNGGGIRQPELINSLISSAEYLLFVEEESKPTLDMIINKISEYRDTEINKLENLN